MTVFGEEGFFQKPVTEIALEDQHVKSAFGEKTVGFKQAEEMNVRSRGIGGGDVSGAEQLFDCANQRSACRCALQGVTGAAETFGQGPPVGQGDNQPRVRPHAARQVFHHGFVIRHMFQNFSKDDDVKSPQFRFFQRLMLKGEIGEWIARCGNLQRWLMRLNRGDGAAKTGEGNRDVPDSTTDFQYPGLSRAAPADHLHEAAQPVPMGGTAVEVGMAQIIRPICRQVFKCFRRNHVFRS